MSTNLSLSPSEGPGAKETRRQTIYLSHTEPADWVQEKWLYWPDPRSVTRGRSQNMTGSL